MTYDHIVAIYNPNSTNDAPAKAADFRDDAARAGVIVQLIETDHAGHAIEIAHDIVSKYDHPLLISVSGDGGYNELINGVIAAKKNTQRRPVVAILAAGNANDQKRATREDTPLLDLILHDEPRPLDLLRLQTDMIYRYAHSYIGLGFTPEVGIELNRHELNRWREIQLVFRSLTRFSPFHITRDNTTNTYASIIFANIRHMSKVLKLDTASNDLQDGKFELIAAPWHGKFRLVMHFLRLATFGAPETPQFHTYSFTTIDSKTPVQLDGEIESIPKDTKVTITAESNTVLSLYTAS